MLDDKTAKLLNILGNPIRVSIVKLVYSESRSFSELMKHLSLESTSKLSFHLEKLENLITKNEFGNYELNELGTRAYFLLKAVEQDELLSPEFMKGGNFLERIGFTKNPAPFLLVSSLLVVTFILLILAFVLRPFYDPQDPIFLTLIYYLVISMPIISFIAYLAIGYNLKLSYEYSVLGAFIVLLFLLSSTNFGFIGTGHLLLGQILFVESPITVFESLTMFIIWLGSYFALIRLWPYILEEFNWKWRRNLSNDYSFDGPKWLSFLRKKKLWLTLLIFYFFIGFLLSHIKYTYTDEHGGIQIPPPYWVWDNLETVYFFPIYLERLIDPILIVTVALCIYLLYNSKKIHSKVKLLGSILFVSFQSLITWMMSFLIYFFDSNMVHTKSVIGMEEMPNLFLFSEILTGIVQLGVNVGFTLLLLIFLYRGKAIASVQNNPTNII